jgi:hypothetical protein
MTQAIVPSDATQLVALTPDQQVQQVVEKTEMVAHAMEAVMKEGADGHYGTIPGCGSKPALFKSGAEKLLVLFQLVVELDVSREDFADIDGHDLHREYVITATLRHRTTGQVWGQGVGSASTLEKKYRWRGTQAACPECGKNAIIKGKAEYGGGWLCFAKKGGCGAKFKENPCPASDPLPNPDLADCWNTVLKMGKKRALVDATLTCTGASDLFTQDIEDLMTTRSSRHGRLRRSQTDSMNLWCLLARRSRSSMPDGMTRRLTRSGRLCGARPKAKAANRTWPTSRN